VKSFRKFLQEQIKTPSVFDAIHAWMRSHVKKSGMGIDPETVTEQHVTEFLDKASNGVDPSDFGEYSNFTERARNTPLQQGKQFLKHLETIAWPDDWATKPRTTGLEQLSDTESTKRNTSLLNMPAGVYMMGSGHLKQIKDILVKKSESTSGSPGVFTDKDGSRHEFTVHGGDQIGANPEEQESVDIGGTARDRIPMGAIQYTITDSEKNRKTQWFVGVKHGEPVSIPNTILKHEILNHGQKTGFYYEGTGEERKQDKLGLAPEDYRGGWDAIISSSINKLKPHHFSTLYANVDHNWNKGISEHFKSENWTRNNNGTYTYTPN
jgi:hypothetical protein